MTLASAASVAALSALAAATLMTPVASAAGICANEARRVEQGSTYLPDCRAYELVTPADKDSGEPKAVTVSDVEPILQGIRGAHASVDGDRMAWDSEYALPGSQAPGLDYLSTRGEDGWSSENVVPPQSVENGLLCLGFPGMVAWSSELERGVFADGYGQELTGSGSENFTGEGLECGHDEPRLVIGEPEGFQNLFVRDNENFVRDKEAGLNPYELVNVTPSGVAPPKPSELPVNEYHPAAFLAGSADLSHVVFEEELALTPGAPLPPADDLYEWTSSGVRLVTFLPDGAPAQGSLAGTTRNDGNVQEHVNIANFRGAVSSDGLRVFFQAGGDLYVRENAEREQSAIAAGSTLVNGEQCSEHEKACTIQLDASQAGGVGGGGEFMAANAEGTKVFFMDNASAKLTNDTGSGSGESLYEYDLEGGTLTDLTPGSEASVQGVSGTGEDGSHVYFVAEGVLTGANAEGASPKPGAPDLYVYEPDPASSGAYRTVFIATLDASSDSCDWAMDTQCTRLDNSRPENSGEETGLTARVSANGAFIGFPSVARPTGFDNTNAATGNPEDEVFLYDAATETLSCASCSPSGAAPIAPAIIPYPAYPDTNQGQRTAYPQRNVSDDGQVFFETSDELLPADTDGKRNVYEYEGGRLYLISSGTSDEDSYFLDTSASGENVFFATAQQLLRRDEDAAYDIYDARVEGGFPEPAAPAPPCAGGEGCRGSAPGPLSFSAPSSASFAGAGNLTPPPSTLPKPKTAVQIKAEKLARALMACRAKHSKHKRAVCESRARKRYGAASKAKKSTRIHRRAK